MRFLKLLLLFLSVGAFGQSGQTVKVQIVDIQSQLPVEGVTVKIPKYNLSQSSDLDGNARFENVPLGRFEIEISTVNYGKHIYKELFLEKSRQFELRVELQSTSTELEAVEVTTANPKTTALMNVETITNEQIFRFPATFFDPARLTMSFAGVANTHDQANNVSVRGNSPDFVQWRLEGVEIVNPNHTNNAGTFSDKPAAAGGGVNILSAQMLGKMDFLSGAFPAGYANSLAGVFDMNLRAGNNEKYEHGVQAGLIGFDLTSEGPISKRTKSSYLVNYRYSFTGLLTQAGIDFGGEAISFQDLAFTLNFPTKKAGTFTFYGIGGNSANIFTPDENASAWETEKDLSHVDYYSRMGLIGVKHSIKILKKYHLKTVVINSATEILRNQYNDDGNLDYDYQGRNYLSFNSTASGNLFEQVAVSGGLGGSYQYYKFNFLNSGTQFYAYDNLLLQPFLKVANRYKSKFNYNIGFISPYYSLSQSQYFEPRASLAYYLSDKSQLKAAYGLHSQVLTSRAGIEELPFKPSRAHHYTLGYQFDVKRNQSFYTEIFYQDLFNLAKFDSLYLSQLNGTDNTVFPDAYYLFKQRHQGRNYGIELSYRHYLDKGFFALANATFYKSQFKAFDDKFYDTRFSGDYIYNITLGKEWGKEGGTIYGFNARMNWLGGFKDYWIKFMSVGGIQIPYSDYSQPPSFKYDDYFRIDMRAYIKRAKRKGSESISLDIQNLTNRKNQAFNYYDYFLQKVVRQNQLGLIPMLNYRREF